VSIAHFEGPLEFFGVQGLKIKLYSGGIFILRSPQTQILLGGFCPFLGPNGVFCGSGSQNQILIWENFSFWGGSQTQNLLRGLLPNFGAKYGILGFWGVKNFGDWFQKTNTTLKIHITLFALKIIAIHDNTLLATFIQLLETVTNRPFSNQRRTAVTRPRIAATSGKRAPFMMLFRRGNKEVHRR
jgi:hypothetical protein